MHAFRCPPDIAGAFCGYVLIVRWLVVVELLAELILEPAHRLATGVEEAGGVWAVVVNLRSV